MKIGVFGNGWWKEACGARSIDAIEFPTASAADGNQYAADLGARLGSGAGLVHQFQAEPVDFLLDNSGTGLSFVSGVADGSSLKPAHEEVGRVLISHFIDPLVTAFQGLDWSVVWQSLKSTTWIKAVWDTAQVAELQRFGIPNVMHLPMAAPNRAYRIEPIDPSSQAQVVSFVGAQNTIFFSAQTQVPTSPLFAGTLAHAVRADLPQRSFLEVFYDMHKLADPVLDGDTVKTQIQKTATYFSAKMYFNAALCVKNRDRFIIFLKRQLGDKFHLIGPGWDRAYGLAAMPRITSNEGYFNHFREVAINLNFVNGNAETGLNMRHFEITAAGGFMLCYEHPELASHFEIGKECATFHDEADLLKKIDYYLANPDQRLTIAQAGQQRTLTEHLYSHRLDRLLQMIEPPKLPVTYSKTNPWDDIRAAVPEPDVVLDCGANIGQTASTFRNLFPTANIYSFEPVGELFEKLQERCKELDVHPVKKAVSDRDGMGTIHLTAGPESNSLLGFQSGNPCAKWTRVVGNESVELCTLDRWCEENKIDHQRVDLVKLDVQGAELKALHGAQRVLKTATAVYLEVSFVSIYKNCPLFGEIDSFMKSHGYDRRALYPSDQPHNWGDALYVKA